MNRAVLWDMDGTLIDSEEFHWISWRDTLAKEGIAVTMSSFSPPSARATIPSFASGWAAHPLQSVGDELQKPKRSSTAI